MDGSPVLVICCAVFHHLLQSFLDKGGAIDIPDCDAAIKDTLDSASIEVAKYPGFYAIPLQPVEEEGPMSRALPKPV